MRLKTLSLALLPLAIAAAAPAFAEDVTADLQISAQVLPGCELTVAGSTQLELGALYQGQGVQSPSGVAARCNTGTAYTIAAGDGLGRGLNPEFAGFRTLTGDRFQLPYRLERGLGVGLEWGQGTDVFAGIGDGEWQYHDYSVSFYAVNQAPNGVYADTVEVTLTY
ncbi:spore coat protein U domain-containing protein [Luteimonas fraxinea]|uniref:Spore coat U domain-containing protein n=1 Tax=Luteimonas fraxinea TaxID=2901869 RepID=A0ABS8UDE9_9GAMM|nr:spore coat protein U domain-containing protein [Luteimonas fraxinea]MCD9096678.1 spore coat U domain-containing protein [Luteimonas fraxinea]MCD9126048.1 spore coat U domain-containing protein [Luteimonas fraxinea]